MLKPTRTTTNIAGPAGALTPRDDVRKQYDFPFVFPRRFRVPAYQSLVPPPAPALEAEMSAVHRGDGGTPRREYLELWTKV